MPLEVPLAASVVVERKEPVGALVVLAPQVAAADLALGDIVAEGVMLELLVAA